MARHPAIIRTERLTLRGIDETDTDEIVRWRSAPEVYRYFKAPHPLTAEEHLNWFRARYLRDENRCDWMCLRREDGQKLGVFGLIRGHGTAEVSYLLAPEAQHCGYAGEAVRALMDYAAEAWGIDRFTAEIHTDNAPSAALAARLGFRPRRQEGDFIIYETEG